MFTIYSYAMCNKYCIIPNSVDICYCILLAVVGLCIRFVCNQRIRVMLILRIIVLYIAIVGIGKCL